MYLLDIFNIIFNHQTFNQET